MPKTKPCSVCVQWWGYEKLHKGEVSCDFSLYILSLLLGTALGLSVLITKFLSNYNLFVTEVITNTHYIPCRNSDKHSKKNLFKIRKPPPQPTHKTISAKMLMTILLRPFLPMQHLSL